MQSGEQTAREFVVGEINRLAAEAKGITTKATADNRPLTDEENVAIKSAITQVTVHKARLQDMDDSKALKDAIDAIAVVGGDATDAPRAPRSVGEAFVKSNAYKSFIARGGPQGEGWRTDVVEVGAALAAKVLGVKLQDVGLDVEATDLAGGTLPLVPQVVPGIVTPAEQRVTVADLFGQGVATQNTIVYLEETNTDTILDINQAYSGGTSEDASVNEGAAKPAVFVDFTKRTTTLEKIAAFLPVSDEMLEDEPQIMSYINGRLSLFVRQAEEAYLLNKLLGSGVGAAGSSDIAGSNTFDAIAAGILSVQVDSGLEPDAVLITPTDFWEMSVLKSAAPEFYFSGGPYASPARNPWGLRAVVTRAAIADKPLVGAFREGATVWRKGGLSISASNSHSDYFRKNLTAIRAEERLALTVFRPLAFQLSTV